MSRTIQHLQKQGVIVVLVSDKRGMVTAQDGTQLQVDESFITTSPYLLDSLYIVGGNTENNAIFTANITEFVNVAYKHYKPIGVATTGEHFIQGAESNNLEGVVFAGNNPDFEEAFVSAIAQQRFWDRT